MTSTALIRPAWTPTTIALTVVGFMVFWPLGLAMIAYIVWGDRFQGASREWKAGNWKGAWNCGRGRGGRNRSEFRGFNATGNVAFDDWRDKELARLQEERRKLDELRDDFDAYARELRRAKDQDEFDRFMRDRSASKPDVDVKPNDPNRPNGDNLLNG